VAFALMTAVIYVLAISLMASLPQLRHPDLVATAVMLDLTIVVPLLFIVMIRRQRRWAGVVPVFLVSLMGAALVLLASSRAALPVLRLLALPAELAIVVLVVWRVRRGLSDLGSDGDVVARLDRAFAAAVPYPRLAPLLAYEMSVLYYGLFSWRDRPADGPGQAFAYHRAGSYGALVFALLIVSACEIGGMHVVVSRASHAVAWLLTAIGLYGVVWILGDFQAARLRPLLVSPDGLRVRLGLRWSLTIPRKEIAAIAPAPKPPLSKRAPGHLHVALLTSPQWQITLSRPLVAQGPYGITKRVTTVAVAADDRRGLRQSLIEQGLLV
jgi:hypothetical protein